MTELSYVEEKLAGIKARMALPIIAAPMFLVSTPELVIEACRAGIMGSFPAPNARTIDDLRAWLEQIKSCLTETAAQGGGTAPWAMNMITHKSYGRFDEEIALVEEYQPDLVITALGGPQKVVDSVRRYGGLVFADVNSPKYAKKAVEAGADGLILICSGAGGHTGTYSHFSFLEEVRKFFDGPLILSGAIANAKAMRAVELLGAEFVYMGTPFIATKESMASPAYRDMVVRCEMEGLTQSRAVTGALGNWMNESLIAAGLTPVELEKSGQVDFSDNMADNKRWKEIWSAGQAVGQVNTVQSVRQLVDNLVEEYHQTLLAEKVDLEERLAGYADTKLKGALSW